MKLGRYKAYKKEDYKEISSTECNLSKDMQWNLFKKLNQWITENGQQIGDQSEDKPFLMVQDWEV